MEASAGPARMTTTTRRPSSAPCSGVSSASASASDKHTSQHVEEAQESNEIVPGEGSSSANPISSAIQEQADLEELVKSLNEQCKIYCRELSQLRWWNFLLVDNQASKTGKQIQSSGSQA